MLMPPPILVVAAALVDGHGRVLVQQCPPGHRWAGLWEFPGGKVESGESLRAALAREIEEELGITIQPDAMQPVGFAECESPRGPLLLLLFASRKWTGEPSAHHASAIAWVDIGALGDFAMPPADVALGAALRRWSAA